VVAAASCRAQVHTQPEFAPMEARRQALRRTVAVVHERDEPLDRPGAARTDFASGAPVCEFTASRDGSGAGVERPLSGKLDTVAVVGSGDVRARIGAKAAQRT